MKKYLTHSTPKPPIAHAFATTSQTPASPSYVRTCPCDTNTFQNTREVHRIVALKTFFHRLLISVSDSDSDIVKLRVRVLVVVDVKRLP